MSRTSFYRRSLVFHWRAHLATALAVAAAGTVLTGALVVGDSMQGSLVEMARTRLGPVDHALVAPRFFGEALAAEIGASPEFKASFRTACPAILLQGSVRHAGSGERAGKVSILGVDGSLWSQLWGDQALDDAAAPRLSVALNEPLARKLGAHQGDDVLVYVASRPAIPAETLLGRRDDAAVALRLTVGRIVPAHGPGSFTLNATPSAPLNAYLPLATLEQALKQPGRVNAMLAADRSPGANPLSQVALLQQLLNRHTRLADLGLKVREDRALGCLSLESEALLIDPTVEAAATQAAGTLGAACAPVLTYLANTISLERANPASSQPSRSPATGPAGRGPIPYSIVAAMDVNPRLAITSLTLSDGRPAPPLRDNEILLDEWAAHQLGARSGDGIGVTYYTPRPFGQLLTESASFRLRGIVRMEGLAADRSLTPEYKGVTDSPHLAAWNPPFPIDLGKVRPQDEQYWDKYGPTPKAFVALQAGQRLWGSTASRFGRVTSIRVGPPQGVDLHAAAAQFEVELLKHLPAATAGMRFEPVRTQALAAAQGNTDFGMLFLGFSLFLIVSAGMLIALVFRLGVERRAREVGILLACGYRAGAVARMLLAEGAVVVGIGSCVGLVGGLGYAWLMLAGLHTWWSAAVSAPFLRLHASGTSLLIGLAAGAVVGLLSIVWAVRGLTRLSARQLLSGAASSEVIVPAKGNATKRGALALAALIAAFLLAGLAIGVDSLPRAPLFFASGAAMLVACLAGLAVRLGQGGAGRILVAGPTAIVRLGLRNAERHPRRSLLTIGLVACATFIIVAVGANRQDAGGERLGRHSGTGGFALWAETTVPILQNLNTAVGQRALNLSTTGVDRLARATVIPLRLRAGDEASCLNLYQPRSPRILGATEALIRRGGFRFQSTLPPAEEEESNPWMLLHRQLPDGAVPAIGDSNTVVWLLHLGLGRDLAVTDDHGRQVRLRIVAMLSGSVLQSELVVAEDRFTELFPSVRGYNVFLIETPAADVEMLSRTLSKELADYGIEVEMTADRLARYLAVENTYLAVFQTLGGLGMVLGTLGLAAVLLRTLIERRGELALLQALGYRRSSLAWLVLAENAGLLAIGLLAGTCSALLAVAPQLVSTQPIVPWASLGLTLIAVLATGIVGGALAVIPTLRSPILASLRNE